MIESGSGVEGIFDGTLDCASFVTVAFVLCADVVQFLVEELTRGAESLGADRIRVDGTAEVARFCE